jgi:hypothetical protein
VYVFDLTGDGYEQSMETSEAMLAIEAATRLSPISHRRMVAIGFDPDRQGLVLVDPKEATGQRQGNSLHLKANRLVFPLNAQAQSDLQAALGPAWADLRRVQATSDTLLLGRSPAMFTVEMLTFYAFDTTTLNATDTLAADTFIRCFTHAGKLFVAPGDDATRRLVVARAAIGRLEEGLKIALDPDRERIKDVLSIVATSAKSELGRTVADSVLDNMENDTLERIEELTYRCYEDILLPDAPPGLRNLFRAHRLGFVGVELGDRLSGTLRRWLHRGLVLDPDGVEISADDSEEEVTAAVNAIRAATVEALGVPLVTFDAAEKRVRLDWTPTKRS